MSKRSTPEKVFAKLCEVEVSLACGETVGQIPCAIAVTMQTYYR